MFHLNNGFVTKKNSVQTIDLKRMLVQTLNFVFKRAEDLPGTPRCFNRLPCGCQAVIGLAGNLDDKLSLKNYTEQGQFPIPRTSSLILIKSFQSIIRLYAS